MSGASDPYKIKWDENPQNPYATTLSSDNATLSSSAVFQKYPDTWTMFKSWADEEKITEPPGTKEERVVLLYSGETERFMEKVAGHIAAKHKYYVLTAPYIFEKGTGKRIAFQPRTKESLNGFIKRIMDASRLAVILYTEQGGQIIETSWCSDMKKPGLGLMQFYRGHGQPQGEEKTCTFLKEAGKLFRCTCGIKAEFKGKVGAYICSDPKVFCPFTQQKITKMIFDIYILNPQMYLFGAEERDELLKPIDGFLANQLKKV